MNTYWKNRFLSLKKLSERYGEEYLQEIYDDYEALYQKLISIDHYSASQVKLDLIALASIHVERLELQLYELAEEIYLRNIYTIKEMEGKLDTFHRYDTNEIDLLLDKEWYNGNWRDRVWYDEGVIDADELAKILREGIVKGYDLEEMADQLMEQFDIMRKRAKKLIYSEVAFITEQATLKSYEDYGVDRYLYVATLEANTCPICGDLDGQDFALSEAVVTVNYPTIHAYCRCTTVPLVTLLPNRVRWYRDPETGKTGFIKDLTFNEWKKQFVRAV